MKKLKDLLYRVRLEAVHGSTEVSIRSIHYDSRKVSLDDMFVAIRGTQSDGHSFISNAVNSGARVVICEELPKEIINGITYVKVIETQEALALIATNYYDNPSKQLKLVGITGTNGKTTVASLLFQLFTKAGKRCGLLSTVVVKIADTSYPATHTTPDPLAIQSYLSEMLEQGVTHVFMEVSSHGIHQKRIVGLQFTGAVFTNLSHDHLDYHETFSAYRDVKKSFFDQLSSNAFALSNIDDKNGQIMLQNCRAKKHSYALKTFADFKGQIIENQLQGLLLKIQEREVWVRLIGDFNAYNLLAIYGSAVLLGMDEMEALKGISDLESVAGRFQYFISPSKITVIVDYAHTPDALSNVLKTIEGIRTRNEKVFTVVGCGGNRDAAKRPIMADIASKMSDWAILTSDNPRFEKAEDIIEQMFSGVEVQNKRKVKTITNRKEAIEIACEMATENDIILIAGKGHETYQEIEGVKFPFDDFGIVKETLLKLNK
jgi:UDP-N-acetylmuramoyl-L-alanyl-D-glutamate--2,6-diaminopimelate ligase